MFVAEKVLLLLVISLTADGLLGATSVTRSAGTPVTKGPFS